MSGDAKSPATDAIRVLIVDDISETRDSLSKLLYFEKDIQVVGTAINGREAIEAAKELQPDIILMDINMPDMDGIKAAEIITAQVPQAQTIMMSVQAESDYLRRSMLAGARDFLIKPFSSDDLINTIHRVYELGATRRVPAPAAAPEAAAAPVAKRPMGKRGGRIITLFSPQGGIGCTTLATNLAIAARLNSNKKVALMDCNLQFGDVGIFLNLQSGKTIVDLATTEELDPEFVEDVMLPHSSGIRVLLAPPRPEMADLITAEHVRHILATLQQRFDLIFVDTWPFLHEITLAVMDLSDRLVLVMSPEIPPIKNAKLLFETLETVQFPMERLVLVLNRVDARGGINPRDIEASIQHRLTAQIVADWRLATYAVNHGVPFVISHRDASLSRAVTELAYLFLAEETAPAVEADRPVEEPAKPAGRRFFGRS